ncbi:MAG: hypothetical protein ABIV50_15200 [Opitutus sp.]
MLRLSSALLLAGLLITSGYAASSTESTVPPAHPSAGPVLAHDPIIAEGLSAEAQFDSRRALDCFLRADAAHPNNGYILQKISRQYSDLTVDTTDVAEKKRLCIAALDYGRRAVDLQPDNAVNVLSLAICYGKLGLYSDTRTKIEYSRLVRQYAERALSLNPDYDYAHHVLGRWHYEVSSLGPATRLIVKVIYGGFPPASTSAAVRHLERAVELSPNLPSHRVELGFALLADGQKDAARASFKQALELPPREKYDTEARQRATAALAKLR